MLLNPRTPIVIGILVVFIVVGLLAFYSPSPGHLSMAHAEIDGVSSVQACASCHSQSGLDDGCLSCHAEIKTQLIEESGYHHHLMTEAETRGETVTCGSCHKEHSGHNFPLTNDDTWGAQVRAAFRHPHVEFGLEGKHDRLECAECHGIKLEEPVVVPGFGIAARPQTFLGLDQDCRSCHDDPHSSGLSGECKTCHGQETFHPTVAFRHADHFALAGPHETDECWRCHSLPPSGTAQRPFPFPFEDARGTECSDCHQTPHHSDLGGACESCHDGTEHEWTTALAHVTPERHAVVGFSLEGPHAAVSCSQCHPRDLAFEERYHDPLEPGYLRTQDTCRGCHEDVHRGQFQERYTRCLDCHQPHAFQPTTFGSERHAVAFELQGAHAGVACSSCHRQDDAIGGRRFVGTTHRCRDCHENPHGKQFAASIEEGDCAACHTDAQHDFRITPFAHGLRTNYALEGAHARAACDDCHVLRPFEVEGAVTMVRQYEKTPTQCGACHTDPHRGQFAEYGADACSRCHVSFEKWKKIEFDHDKHSRFPLEGAHARATCTQCHLPSRQADGESVLVYKPLETQCGSCHDIPR